MKSEVVEVLFYQQTQVQKKVFSEIILNCYFLEKI